MKKLSQLTIVAALTASPAFAASGPFFSLANTDFVVLLGFLLLIGILVWQNVPNLIGGLLDNRATAIQTELEEARALREEAQTILASYERKQREVQEHANAIVEQAGKDAKAAAKQAKADLKDTIKRRLAAAQEQIGAAEASAVREVRDAAIVVAIGAASDVVAKNMSAADAGSLIDEAIGELGEKLH